MCWVGKDKKQIAEKDIAVFKIVRKYMYNFFSFYYPKR